VVKHVILVILTVILLALIVRVIGVMMVNIVILAPTLAHRRTMMPNVVMTEK
jgi:hypothetical protein